jgi:hypothetical protein
MRTFGHDIPRLSWLNGKTYPQHGMSRTRISGHGPEHREANREWWRRQADEFATVEYRPVQLVLTGTVRGKA